MTSKDKITLCGLFHVDPFPISEESARALVGPDVSLDLPEHLQDLGARQRERRIAALVSGRTTTISFGNSRPGGTAQSLDANVGASHRKPGVVYESTDTLVEGFPVAPGSGLLSFFFEPRTPSDAGSAAFHAAAAEAMVHAFDVLHPTWGAVDWGKRLGLGRGEDPRSTPHWLNFFSPDQAAEAHALAERFNADVDERDWGGFIVQCWDDPYHTPSEADAPLVPASPSAPAFPDQAVWVAGARVPAGTAVARGPLHLFSPATGGDLVAGIPLMVLRTAGQAATHAGPVDLDDVRAALDESAKHLTAMGVDQAPRLHLVWREQEET